MFFVNSKDDIPSKVSHTFKKAKQKVDTDKMFEDCINHFTSKEAKKLNLAERGHLSKEEIISEVERFLYDNSDNQLSEDDVKKISDNFEKFIWGYYLLDELIDDPTISDIKIISKDIVRIKRQGKRLTSGITFPSDELVKNFVNRVATKNKISLSDINAIQTFTDKFSSEDFILRINIATEYVNSSSTPYLHIRKIPKQKYTKEEIIKFGLVTEEQLNFLIDKVRNGKGVIFTGKGASGKTTLMNILIDEIPEDKSGLVIQENEELFSNTHPDLMFQKVRYSRGEGRIQYTLRDLAINGLLTDLDYFIIGEIKGAEALYFLNASYTGHKCMASVHGNSSTEAMDKLVDYMKYESDYDKKDLLKMLVNMDTVCYLENFKIQEISEISGFDEEKNKLTYNMVYKGTEKINESCR